MNPSSPASAIAWQLWRRNRWAALCTLAALPLSLLINGLTLSVFPDLPEGVMVMECFAALFSFVGLFWIFSHTDNDAQGRHLGYPARLYTLPARTATLVNWPVGLGLVVVISMYFAWAAVIQWQWGTAVPWPTRRWYALGLATMLLTLQALVWSLHRSPWVLAALLIVLMTGLGMAVIVVPEMEFRPLGPTGWKITLSLWLLCAYVGAFTGIARDRRGEGQGWTGRMLHQMLDVLPRRRSDFTSPARAQFWFEWQRRGIFGSCLLGVMMAGTLFCAPLPAAMHLDPVATAINYLVLPIMTLSLATGAGAGLARSDAWLREKAFHPFNAIRPISTGDMVIAKMKAAALMTLLGWTVFLILAVPAFNLGHGIESWKGGGLGLQSWNEFWPQHPALWRFATHPVTLLTAMGMTWLAIVRSMALGLIGRTRRIVFWTWVGVGRWVSLVILTVWLYRHPAHWAQILATLPWITGMIVLVKTGLATRNFREVRRRDLHPRQIFWSLVAIWLTLAAGLTISAGLLQSATQWPWSLVAFLIGLLLPGGELPACSINLASNRHR